MAIFNPDDIKGTVALTTFNGDISDTNTTTTFKLGTSTNTISSSNTITLGQTFPMVDIGIDSGWNTTNVGLLTPTPNRDNMWLEAQIKLKKIELEGLEKELAEKKEAIRKKEHEKFNKYKSKRFKNI